MHGHGLDTVVSVARSLWSLVVRGEGDDGVRISHCVSQWAGVQELVSKNADSIDCLQDESVVTFGLTD